MAPPTRDDALAFLEQGQGEMQSLLARLSESQLIEPSTIGGGDWSAKDLIGHIALWEEIALVTMEAWLRGKRPPIEETFTVRGTDDLNAWNQDRKRTWPLERVWADSEGTHRRLVSAIANMTDDDWASPKTFEGDQREDLRTELGGVLGAPNKSFGHVYAHLPDLTAYVEQVAS